MCVLLKYFIIYRYGNSVRICGQFSNMQVVFEYVGSLRICWQFSNMRIVFENVGSFRTCWQLSNLQVVLTYGQFSNMWVVFEYLSSFRIYGQFMNMWVDPKCSKFAGEATYRLLVTIQSNCSDIDDVCNMPCVTFNLYALSEKTRCRIHSLKSKRKYGIKLL